MNSLTKSTDRQLSSKGASDSNRNLTEKQECFLSVLFSEAQGDLRAAMDIAGYSEGTPVSIVVNSLHQEITEAASKYLAANSGAAVANLLSVLHNPTAPGSETKLKAIREILDRGGVFKKQEGGDLNLTIPSGGLVILPAKDARPAEFEQEDSEDEIEVEYEEVQTKARDHPRRNSERMFSVPKESVSNS